VTDENSNATRSVSAKILNAQNCLPLHHMQAALRSPAWGEDLTHELRCEWLHRLNLLRTSAIRQLLQSGHRNMNKAGLELWSGHRHWPVLHALRQQKPGEDMERMELLLFLTCCESLLSEGES